MGMETLRCTYTPGGQVPLFPLEPIDLKALTSIIQALMLSLNLNLNLRF